MPINSSPTKDKRNMSKREQEKKELSFFVTEAGYSFDDIVLSDEIRKEIDGFIALDKYRTVIYDEWGLGTVIKRQKNITVNLYGDSGTGKTMTAHAIANKLEKKLLVVDYSEIESKYVGETSKNLVSLFKNAQEKDAVILFDEADALLSKRVTSMQSATDISVNQTRNILLQLLDNHEGIVLFTTNFISNFDPAFLRRILFHIKFGLPNEEMRQKLWAHYIVDKLPIASSKEEMVKEISKIGNVSSADISNAVLKAAISAAQRKRQKISKEDLKTIVEQISTVKDEVENDNYQISTKKVSEEYVKEKLGKDVLDNGSVRDNSKVCSSGFSLRSQEENRKGNCKVQG